MLPLSSMSGDIKWNSVQVPHAAGWTISDTVAALTYNTNLTRGRISRRPGPIDLTGTFRILATADVDGAPPILAGQIAKLELYPDADANPWTITNAMILSVSEEVNVESGALVALVYNWGFAGKDDATNGTVTTPDGTVLDVDALGEV